MKKATRIKGMQGFKASAVSLPSIHVETVGPFIFANLPLPSPAHSSSSPTPASGPPPSSSPCPPPSLEPLQTIHRVLAETGYERLHYVRRMTYDLRCNWKVFVDNYLDGGYHVQYAHPTLAAALQMAQYKTEVLSPEVSLQTSETVGEGRVTGRAVYLFLYPTADGPIAMADGWTPTGWYR